MNWSEAVDRAGGLSAIVSQPVAGLRASPDPRSELVSQEIYGRSVRVAEVKHDWCLCVAVDSERGWMPASYLSPMVRYRPGHAVANRFANLSLSNHSDVILPMGSLLEVSLRGGKNWQVRTPEGAMGTVPGSSLRSRRTMRPSPKSFSPILKQVMGVPYLWGGKSTFGFDCSGLVQFLYEFFAVGLPRNSRDQARCGRKISRLEHARPFDLLFFTDRGVVNHVVIHLGGLDILHASGRVRVESLDAASDCFRVDLLARFAFGRRVIG
jgi:hypothetical protein